MKISLMLLCLSSTFCFAQSISTKTMYKSYPIGQAPLLLIPEEITTYNKAGQAIQTMTMGIISPALSTIDTMAIRSSIGLDSFVIVAKENYDFTKVATKETLSYAYNQLIANTTTNYFIANNVLDSTVEFHAFEYLPNNKVLKSTTVNGISSTKNYLQDANGIKITERYDCVFDKRNRLIEKFARGDIKKTARVEKYTYNNNGNKMQYTILQGKKIKTTTKYIYNKKNQILLETTKNIAGKKNSIDTITYEYTTGNCTKETTHTNGEIDTIVEYSYTFF